MTAKIRYERSPGEPRWIAFLYLLPALAVYLAFVVAPMLHGVEISFFRWDGVTRGTWVGLSNYTDALTDPGVRAEFLRSFVLVAFYALLPIAVGLILASALSRSQLRFMAFFRTVLFLPQVIATVVVAVTWRWLYAPNGPIDQLLRAIGLGGLSRSWLGDYTWALPATGLVGTWVTFGLCMVLFIAGVQQIPPPLYDAVRVDGGGPIREFFAVTLPGLRNPLAVALSLTVIGGLRTFDLIYLTTKGGPGDQTMVPSLDIYQRAFSTGQVGSAAALGVILTILIFAVTFLITRLVEGER
jgi:raffinose/stachyose/melibiose transport system permease protein